MVGSYSGDDSWGFSVLEEVFYLSVELNLFEVSSFFVLFNYSEEGKVFLFENMVVDDLRRVFASL